MREQKATYATISEALGIPVNTIKTFCRRNSMATEAPLLGYTTATTITQRTVAELIDHIDVYHAEKHDGITTQQVIIHYNCVGPFMVPDRRKIPEAAIIMETRKGVALSYAPAQIAV